MLYKRPAVGKEVNAYCGKCKLERTHIVAAMDGADIRKVTCNTCRSTHNFKEKAPVTAATKAKKTKAATASGDAPKTKTVRTTRRSKEAVFAVDPNRPVRSYNMNSMFTTGDVINHPKFGIGAVELSVPPNKIEVRFQEGKKLLLHNMKNFRP
jgi:hypothetical protein